MKKQHKKWYGIGAVVLVCFALVAIAHLIVRNTSDNGVRSALIQTFPYSVAEVNGEHIRLREYEQRLADTRFYFDRQEEYGVDLVERPSDDFLQDTVLQNMIDTVLLEQIAEEYGIVVESGDLSEYYQNVIVTQEAGGESVIEGDLERFYGWTPEEFQKNVLYPVVLREHIAEAMKDDDAINAEPQERAQEIFERVTAGGEDFATVAQEESDDEATAESGGSLGAIAKGQYDSAFEEAVFATEPGSIVGPVRSTIGYHVIQVNSVDSQAGSAQVQHILVKTESVDELLTQATVDADIDTSLPRS